MELVNLIGRFIVALIRYFFIAVLCIVAYLIYLGVTHPVRSPSLRSVQQISGEEPLRVHYTAEQLTHLLDEQIIAQRAADGKTLTNAARSYTTVMYSYFGTSTTWSYYDGDDLIETKLPPPRFLTDRMITYTAPKGHYAKKPQERIIYYSHITELTFYPEKGEADIEISYNSAGGSERVYFYTVAPMIAADACMAIVAAVRAQGGSATVSKRDSKFW